MASALDKLAFETAQAARIGWFFGQKILAARVSRPAPAQAASTPAASRSGESTPGQSTPAVLKGRRTPDRQRLVSDLWRLIEQDWRNIAGGLYAPPEDWRGNPLDRLRRAVDFFADLGAVEARRHGDPADALLPEAEAERYPAYYRRKFHFQSDGYLSKASAERYDHQVEVLFGGGAAAMRRQGLVPLREALRRHEGGSATARLLDIGCGTGAFLREVKRNYPRLAVTGRDLSAPYLAVAGKRLAEWSRVELTEGAAEAMPFGDGAFDIVSCIYVFHELPPRVRRAVVAEIGRLLRPGGTLILVDSLQTGDEPDYDMLLEYFPVATHEPFYTSYLRTDLNLLFAPAFEQLSSTLAYFSKVISYRRTTTGGAD